MKPKVIYLPGQGGSAEEAQHYQPLFPDRDVIGLNYTSQTPWEAKEEFPKLLASVCEAGQPVILIANSIGAFFAMHALGQTQIEKAFFISPIVNMEQLIDTMLTWANASRAELEERGTIETNFGQTLSWDYLCYVRDHPTTWKIPTHILYGEKDHLTPLQTISQFAQETGASLTILQSGEHWFHTEEQMQFLDNWVIAARK